MLKSTPNDIGTWFRVLLLCGVQENGGRIKDGLELTNNQWIQACGVTKRDVVKLIAKGNLLCDDAEKKGDLIVWGYPLHFETQLKAKREWGRAAAAKRWDCDHGSPNTRPIAKPNAESITGPTPTPINEPIGSPNTEPIGSPNAKRGKVRERENKDSNTTKPLNADAIEEIYLAYPKHVGKKAALKAISKALQQIDAKSLLDRTKAFAAAVATWPKARLQFRPDPASWFNAGRYEDDPREWEDEKKPRVHPLGGEIDPNFDSSKPNAHTGGVPLAN